LKNRVTGILFPGEAKNFSSRLYVQTSSRPTQPPAQWVPGVFSLGREGSWGAMLTTHPI
jgi:hypothetical protein